MNQPLISIIIPAYNRSHLIGETLNSIRIQNYNNWECIIVDDGSFDNTEFIVKEYIKKDTRFQFHRRPVLKIKGANSCRNYGFNLSKGEWIKWLDSDDLLDKDALINESKLISESLDVIISPLILYDFTLQKEIKKSNIISANLIHDYFLGNVALYVSGPVWKRSFLNRQEYLFDEKISNVDDWDFNMRMLYSKPVICFNDSPTVFYRIHENSLSHEIKKGNELEIVSVFNALEKHLKLIKTNKIIPYKPLLKYTVKYFTASIYNALLQKKDYSANLYFRLVKVHFFYLYNFGALIKVGFGVLIYKFCHKGYIFFK